MRREPAEWLLEAEPDGWELVDAAHGGHGLVVSGSPEKRLREPA
jgi:hypothetical protein